MEGECLGENSIDFLHRPLELFGGDAGEEGGGEVRFKPVVEPKHGDVPAATDNQGLLVQGEPTPTGGRGGVVQLAKAFRVLDSLDVHHFQKLRLRLLLLRKKG